MIVMAIAAACASRPMPATDAAGAARSDAIVARDVTSGPPSVIHVVRHAEATAPTGDPPLSEAGIARARRLATAMADKQLAAIDTTQLERAHETGKIVADAVGLVVELQPVDPANVPAYPPALAAHVKAAHAGQTMLVVGHSNTVPAFVEALSGTAVPPIATTEYDRLYTITIAADGTAQLESGTY